MPVRPGVVSPVGGVAHHPRPHRDPELGCPLDAEADGITPTTVEEIPSTWSERPEGGPG